MLGGRIGAGNRLGVILRREGERAPSAQHNRFMTANVSSPFRFDVEKAIQAVGVVLREEPGHRINYMKLLKLLAIAERESLKETGTMITGDCISAMDRGPVLSSVYNLIKGEHSRTADWDSFIERERYHVLLRERRPGVSRLSRFAIAKLTEVTKRHANDDEWEMVRITHRHEEWKKNRPSEGSSKPIPITDVLAAMKMSEEEASAILGEAESQLQIDMFFTRNNAWGKKMPSQSQRSTITSTS